MKSSLLFLIMLFTLSSCSHQKPKPTVTLQDDEHSEVPFVTLPKPDVLHEVVLAAREFEWVTFQNLLRFPENRKVTGLDPRQGVEPHQFPTEPEARMVFLSKPQFEVMIYRMGFEGISKEGYLISFVHSQTRPRTGIYGYFKLTGEHLERVELPFPRLLLATPFIEAHNGVKRFRFLHQDGKAWDVHEYEWTRAKFSLKTRESAPVVPTYGE